MEGVRGRNKKLFGFIGRAAAAAPEGARHYKMVLIGNTGVGKSSLLRRAIHGSFAPECDSTIGAAFMMKSVGDSGESSTSATPLFRKVYFDIWDTAGQERYMSLVPMYTRKADVVMACYDVGNSRSLRDLRDTWLPGVLDTVGDGPPGPEIVLVGCKSDRVRDPLVADLLAEPWALGRIHLAVSAASGANVDNLFEAVSQRAISNGAPKETSRETVQIGGGSARARAPRRFVRKPSCC